MKTNTLTALKSMLFTLFTVSGFAGDLDGLWRTTDQSKQIEIMYTTHGIKARQANHSGNDWVGFDRLDNNRYRDARGNSLSLFGSTLEWCTPDRRQIINYVRYNDTQTGYGEYENDRRNNSGRNDYEARKDDWNRNDRNQSRDWNKRDWDNWNNYYKSYEGKWHNHTTGEKIIVDLTRHNLRIKFAGEKWFEVIERNRGLFVDKRGNEFVFRDDNIVFRSADGDLSMRFFGDARCNHRDDYRSEYWR